MKAAASAGWAAFLLAGPGARSFANQEFLLPPAALRVPPPRLPAADPPAPPAALGAALVPVAPAAWPELEDDRDPDSLREAIRATYAYLDRFPDAQEVRFGPRRSSVGELRRTLAAFAEVLELPESERAAALRARFDLFRSRGDARGRVVFTGYFEPVIPGRLAPGPGAAPVYARPPELAKVERRPGFPYDYARRAPDGRHAPFADRAAIDAGALAGRGLELAWADPADLLFLQTQGSGWLELPDGARLHLGFDGANGRPFRSVAAALMRAGELPAGTHALAALAHLKRQPERLKRALIRINPRYVFFRRLPGGTGPLGTARVPLTAGRSLAVGRGLPLGALAYLGTTVPLADRLGRPAGFARARRFALSQDTGSALVDPGRVDLFWGAGPRAAAEASRMKARGELYFLLLKPADPAAASAR